ncbi:aconitase X [Mesorhizobium sp. ES1-1]|uniref:aconitase X n=1 Tax=Mesorhizobium sp. ES1-1 TaxID=2876629 RepID=UPI001CCD3C0B|nr:aconitase X [Mesorhizobium sp. ES1-1]MBZ9675730.1 aconitase X [Mesorhizobium sp. ES1-1]
MTLELTAQDRSVLDGGQGPSAAAAMKILVAFSNAIGAGSLLDISGAHIDGCLYHGKAGLDFVERLVEGGGRVRVPTTLNVGSFDLIHPGMVKMPEGEEVPARRLMTAHMELGCQATFTCAPYQTRFRPEFGQQIAWGESNAIVFANSVIGARTNRYGDFIDLCCALTGRAPAWGLHLSDNRRGRILFELDIAEPAPSDSLFVGVGLIVGQASGDRIPVISGLPRPRDEDQLKALGAAAATTGAVALFHAVGITPEAGTLDEAFQGHAPEETIRVTQADIDHALARLSAVPDGAPLSAVSLGTPHFSHEEWVRLLSLLHAVAPGRGIPIYVNTGRATLTRLQEEGALAGMEAFGLIPVADTCTYVTSILKRLDGVVMTNSGKWAHYAPGNIGVTVAFADVEDCIRSAAAGHVVRSAP